MFENRRDAETQRKQDFEFSASRRLCVCFIFPWFLLAVSEPASAGGPERFDLERLRATFEAVERFATERRDVELTTGYDDVRAQIHVHSYFSHDSRGTLEEIVAAAKAVGARVVMFTEHPAPHYDYVLDGHRGIKEGVLLIPGAETEGFLAFPTKSLKDAVAGSPQQRCDLILPDGGVAFLAHLEERMDWQVEGLTGTEIYNTHADFKEDASLIALFRSPLGFLSLVPAIRQYPQAAFVALHDYPADYLRRYDELCLIAPHTGVAANDAHHNQVYRLKLAEGDRVVLEDALGKELAAVDVSSAAFIKPLVADKRPGDTLFELDLDPYERSFKHVSTHLLVESLDETSVRQALAAGRAYVAFDWIADPTGFMFQAQADGQTWPLGSQIESVPGLRLMAECPLAATLKLVRNGEEIGQSTGRTLEHAVMEPGNYRLEAWLTIAGEPRPWILSNPIYVRS